MAESLIGREVGQYKIVAELGRGQHSTVYKAWQPSLERYVALKVLRHYDQATLEKFQAEARLVAQLAQQGVPNIRQVYEVGQTADGYLFVALQYVEDSLRNVLRRAQEHNRRFRPEAAARLLRPIAVALDALHSLGWVHLDIKPQNILITKGGRAVLADFGIAQRRGMVTHACTPAYASPEQAAGDRPVGPWSDIYSLGVVLYEMVGGHPPVRGDQDIVLLTQHLEVTPPSPRKVNAHLTSSQERAIFKALAKSPHERFGTAGEFIEALLEPAPFLSNVIKTPQALLSTTSRRAPRLLLVALILLLIVAVAVAVMWLFWPGLFAATPSGTPTAAAVLPTSTVGPTMARPTSTPAPPTATEAPTATLVPTATLAATPTPPPSPGATTSPSP